MLVGSGADDGRRFALGVPLLIHCIVLGPVRLVFILFGNNLCFAPSSLPQRS